MYSFTRFRRILPLVGVIGGGFLYTQSATKCAAPLVAAEKKPEPNIEEIATLSNGGKIISMFGYRSIFYIWMGSGVLILGILVAASMTSKRTESGRLALRAAEEAVFASNAISRRFGKFVVNGTFSVRPQGPDFTGNFQIIFGGVVPARVTFEGTFITSSRFFIRNLSVYINEGTLKKVIDDRRQAAIIAGMRKDTDPEIEIFGNVPTDKEGYIKVQVFPDVPDVDYDPLANEKLQ